MNRPVSLKTTKAVLSDLFRAHDRKVTIDDIKRKTAGFYDIKLSDMSSNRRLRAIARPRQVAMYLAKKMTPTSLPEIGRQFGGRDHTTVMHAVRKINELVAADPQLGTDLEQLEASLKEL
jgi:chromosomal replication initiator protein